MSQPVHFVRSDSDENEEEQDRTIPEFIERYETEEQDESIEYEDIVFEGGDSVDEFYYEDEDQPTFHPHAGIIENIQNLSQTGTPNSFGFDFNSSDNEAGFDGNSLTGRFPFKRTLTAKIPDEIPAEDLEHGAVVEAPEVVTCCFGCIPQTPILFFLNVALIVSLMQRTTQKFKDALQDTCSTLTHYMNRFLQSVAFPSPVTPSIEVSMVLWDFPPWNNWSFPAPCHPPSSLSFLVYLLPLQVESELICTITCG